MTADCSLGMMMRVVTADETLHRAVVRERIERAAPGGSVDSLLRAADDAFAALWQRAVLTLGEVMLIAVVERALYTGIEAYPVLESVEVVPTGLRFQEVRARGGVRAEDVSAAVQFVLVEILTVLGHLTAQILTPALHAELSKGEPS